MARKRRCRSCGKPEKVNAIGYTNIAPFMGVCVDCINKAADEADRRGLPPGEILLPRPKRRKRT